MKKKELYKAMKDIVNSTVNIYASDLDYDIAIIEKWDARPTKAAWLVRELGTNFQELTSAIEPLEYIDAVYNNMRVEASYIITFDGRGEYSIKEATRADYEAAYMTAKHYSIALYRPYGEPTIYTGAYNNMDDAESAAEYIKDKVGYTAQSVVYIKPAGYPTESTYIGRGGR